jgi:hypothetical protein
VRFWAHRGGHPDERVVLVADERDVDGAAIQDVEGAPPVVLLGWNSAERRAPRGCCSRRSIVSINAHGDGGHADYRGSTFTFCVGIPSPSRSAVMVIVFHRSLLFAGRIWSFVRCVFPASRTP